ncbi:MAG: hypothetical protein RIB60_09770 [Phycisphaerales bacterium]
MRRSTNQARARFTTTGGAVCFALAAAVIVGGCQKTPLRKDDQRSQFDRYDATRNERAPAYVQDAFGRRQPNLRGRLMGND